MRRRWGARATTYRRVRGTSLTTHRSCAPTATSSGIHNTGTRCNVLFDDARLPSPGATHRALPPLPLAEASTYNSCVDGPRPRGERTSACNVGGDGAPRGVVGGARVQWCAVMVQDVAPYSTVLHGGAASHETPPMATNSRRERIIAHRRGGSSATSGPGTCSSVTGASDGVSVRPLPSVQGWALAPGTDGADCDTAALLCSLTKPPGDITTP